MQTPTGTGPTTRDDIVAVYDGPRVIGYVVERGWQDYTAHAIDGGQVGPHFVTDLGAVRAVQQAAGLGPAR